MRVTVTGATGLIGSRLVRELRARGDEVTALSRNPERLAGAVEAVAWDPQAGAAPAEALAGRDGVVHLAGENIAQRWTAGVRRRIHESRERGTQGLVEGIRAAEPRPRVLVSMSGVDYYGDRGDARIDEDTPPGDGFLPRVCVAWEREAEAAAELGVRVVRTRNGIVLDRRGGALARMLPPFRLGVGGPVAGGRQYMPWIHLDDQVAVIRYVIEHDSVSGAVNACSPNPVTNREFTAAFGRAVRRPAPWFAPAPAIKLAIGDTDGETLYSQRMVPKVLTDNGFTHRHPDLAETLSSLLD
jgi:uncharacterized protein (TIGR01777 family)